MKKIFLLLMMIFSFFLWASPEDDMAEIDGAIKVYFFDAITGKPLEAAKVEIEEIGNYTSNSQGEIVLNIDFFEIEDKDYKMIVSKEKYITSEFALQIEGGSIYMNRFSISPKMDLENLRIVLDWGNNPKDLDIHLLKEEQYHISYRNMKEYKDQAKLDRDDTDGYGPETITIKKVEKTAVYKCFVEDFSNNGKSNSKSLAKSKACIKVYVENKLEKVFYVPRKNKGFIWNVFEINNAEINEVGTISN